MEFDSSFATKFPHLSGIFSENPCTKPDIPSMVHVQSNSILPPHPSHNTTFLNQNNIHQFQSHYLIGANHHSINPFRMIPTPSFPNSYKVEHNNESRRDFFSTCNPVTFAPNNDKVEGMDGYADNSKNLQDFSRTNPPEFGQISQVGPSRSQSLLYDAHTSTPLNLKFQDEISCVLGTGGNLSGTDLKLIVGQRKQTSFQRKSSENHDEDIDIIKGQWTAEEDRALTELVEELVEEFDSKKWAKIARFMKWRTGKQCRDRWNNHLRPDITKVPWNECEEQLLIEAHITFGNKWTKIAKKLPWRSENSIKNHWNNAKRRLNTKGKQTTHNDGSKGTLLLNYIKEVIAAEGDEKEMKKPMSMIALHSEEEKSHMYNKNLGSVNLRQESPEVDFSYNYWATQEDEVSGSGVMDYELGVEINDPTKKEMDFLDMIFLNP